MTVRSLENLADETGDVERRHNVLRWEVPRVLELEEVAGAMGLRWQRFDPATRERVPTLVRATNGDQLLTRFLGLLRRTPDDVLRFARRFGVLKTCERQGHDIDGYGCEGSQPHFELLAAWVERMEKFEAMARIASQLYRTAGKIPREVELWRKIEVGNLPTTMESARSCALITLQRWLRYYPVTVFPRWDLGMDAPGLALSPRGLAGALILQLASAVTRAAPMACCNSCGEWFSPKRVPRLNQRSFCAECVDAGAPLRVAQRDRRSRIRAIGTTPISKKPVRANRRESASTRRGR